MYYQGAGADRQLILSSRFGTRVAKRVFDVLFAGAALTALSLVMVSIAVMIKALDGGPVFYVQKRVGRDGRLFGCLKFRSMVTDADARLEETLRTDPEARRQWETHRKLQVDPRVIPGVGELLRKYSLDELPQFMNVLLGDMSIVGPRPVTKDELRLYGDSVEYYLAVKPGITGAWQVSGRNGLNYDERVRLDRTYVETWSMWKDLRIIAATVGVVFSGKGAY